MLLYLSICIAIFNMGFPRWMDIIITYIVTNWRNDKFGNRPCNSRGDQKDVTIVQLIAYKNSMFNIRKSFSKLNFLNWRSWLLTVFFLHLSSFLIISIKENDPQLKEFNTIPTHFHLTST